MIRPVATTLRGPSARRRRFPRGLMTVLAGVLAGLLLAACASTDSGAGVPPGYVAVADVATPLGLQELPQERSGRVVLQGPRGDRIALIPGTDQVMVRGNRFTTRHPVIAADGTAWVESSDASLLRRAWGSTYVQPAPFERRPTTFNTSRRPRYSPPATPSPGSPDYRLPPPVTHTPAPAMPSAPDTSNAPSLAERAAWSVPLRRRWMYIVVHHSATPNGNASTFDAAHRAKGWDGLGYDFVIGNGAGSPDGRVETGFRWKQQRDGAHAGNDLMNQHGIGICLVGDFSKTRPTAAQMRSLERLCGFLAAYCGIPPENLRLHSNFRETECPGANFPRSFAFRATPGVPRGTVVAAR